ncbi:hypothetical protein LY78DRAFT_334327 [Colletotrichum sublineola]|uniref:Uncharacterized protein n=1 Tax=Colletotrichum sublineola TaxID=1173701 RepID=A0A066XCB3_COLSU|nr:hypothetical protein LY78DRAFT_334327 [Colletotrichum sublineola]KDN66818.1 hypothetical protein CSUB01_03001 [Colletotrichum sublineola]
MTAIVSTAPFAVVDPLAQKIKDSAAVNVDEVDINNTGRFLVHSPYTGPEHLLDLDTLDDENALLARALSRMECLRADYATADYVESFNWEDVMSELKSLIQSTGKKFKETSFYIVAFRSTIPPSTVYEDLGILDKAAHAEANQVGGFLKYWFGSPDSEGRNLATCVWRSRPDAVKAGHGPAHRRASRATASMYSFWRIDRHRLVIRDGAESWELVDWVD